MKLETVVAKRAEKTVYRDGDMAIKLFEKSFSKASRFLSCQVPKSAFWA